MREFPQEEILHDIPASELDAAYGAGNWKGMPDEISWQLRFEPARWVAEKHVVRYMWAQEDPIRTSSCGRPSGYPV